MDLKFIAILIVLVSQISLADELPKDLVRELSSCHIMAIVNGGEEWDCLQKEKSEEQEGMPCWLGGKSSPSITTSLAILNSHSLPINLEDWQGDLNARIQIGDYRIIGIGGIGIGYPALEDNEDLCILGGRYIKGTSDVMESEEHAALQRKFSEYAEKYNGKLLRLYSRGELPLNK